MVLFSQPPHSPISVVSRRVHLMSSLPLALGQAGTILTTSTFPHFCGQLLVESMQSLNLVFCPFLWSAVGRVYAVPRILEQPLSFIAYLGNELRNDWSSRVYLTPDWLRGDGLAPIQNIRTSGAMCHLRSSELSRPVRGCTYRSVAISRLCSFSSLIIGNSFSCPCFCPKLPLNC